MTTKMKLPYGKRFPLIYELLVADFGKTETVHRGKKFAVTLPSWRRTLVIILMIVAVFSPLLYAATQTQGKPYF